MNKNKETKNKIKLLKFVTVFFLIVLFLELSYMIYKMSYQVNKEIYFDGINSIVKIDKGYIGVGGNNDNEKLYEKAKITRYDEKKEKIFENLYNKGIASTYNSVCVDNDYFVAVGKYTKNAKDYEKDYTQGLIVKYDKSGKIVWEKHFSDAEKTNFRKIKKVNDKYIVVGESLFERENKSLIGGAYIIMYDEDGSIVWQQRYGNNSMALFNDFLVIDDNIYVVGKNNENLGIIIKYDMSGNMLDEKSYDGVDNLGFSSVCLEDDFLYVVGAKGNDSLLLKYDLEGELISEKFYSEKNKSRFNRIITDENGNLIVIGIRYNEKRQIHDGIIAKYDKDLEKQAIIFYDEDSDAYFTDVILDEKNYLVVGYSLYEDAYLTKFNLYSNALKELGVNG